MLKLADAFAATGVAVRVHTLQPIPDDLTATNIVGYPAIRAIPRLGISPAMRRGLAQGDADLVHNNGVWMMPNIYAGMIARRRRIPLVFSPRGMFSEWALGFSRGRKRFAWWCLGATARRRGHHLLPCDVGERGAGHPPAGVPAAGRRDSQRRRPPPARGCSGTAGRSARRRLLFLSRIHPKKGIPILLRAWQSVERHEADWELVVAGPDEAGHLPQMQALAGELGLRRVAFPGPAYGDAKAALYRSADLFVLPTHSENFGMAIAEALAYAVPVITTTGAPWAGLQERDCGWWIELSEANLADALRTAMNLPWAVRAEMGRRGRLWMEQSYGWDRIATEMKSVYDWLLGGGAPPSCVVTDGPMR